MATPHSRIHADGIGESHRTNGDAPLRDLLRQLADDGSALIRSEITLAKVELTESAKQYGQDGARIAVALGIAWLGALALTAALIIGIGVALGGMYWAAALIVGLLFVAIGGFLAKRGIAGMQRNSLAPETTVRSLQRDRNMVRNELREIRDGLRS